MQRLGKNVTAATNAHSTIEYTSFLFCPCPIKESRRIILPANSCLFVASIQYFSYHCESRQTNFTTHIMYIGIPEYNFTKVSLIIRLSANASSLSFESSLHPCLINFLDPLVYLLCLLSTSTVLQSCTLLIIFLQMLLFLLTIISV
jgi:hypothetical protein